MESGNSMVFSLVGVVVSGRHREGAGVGRKMKVVAIYSI